jgi:hypothetical protein
MLVDRMSRAHNLSMRALAVLLVVAAFLFGIYHFYLTKMPTSDSGTAATQAISLTGVRADLLQIAEAERGNIALNGRCSPLEDLISSGSLGMEHSGRDGYSYEIDCSGAAEFEVLAKHAAAPAGSGIRYPQLAINSNMEIREVQP